MSQFTAGDINPDTTSGPDLANILEGVEQAARTAHRGATRPPYATAGLIWADDSAAPLVTVYWFDGTDDIALMTVNETTNTVSIDADLLDGLDSTAFELVANKGSVNGYASLDAGGKVPTSELPASVVGAVAYQGTWNASTNTPALSGGSGTQGHYYRVSVAGSTNLDGITDWAVGDHVIFDGTAWDKIDNTDQVVSVHGRQGAVVGASGDYTASQITNAPAGSISATDVQAAINELASEKLSDVVSDVNPQLGGNLDAQGNQISDAVIKDYEVANQDGSSVSGVLTLTYSDGPDFDVELSESITSIVINGWPASGPLAKVTIQFRQPTSGVHTVDFSGIDFGDAGAPTMPTGTGAVLELATWSRDGGTTKYGAKYLEKAGA